MKITIITACWNAVATIGDAIESVRRQKLPEGVELEHLMIDGGSSDGTVELIGKFELGIRNEGRAGFSFKWISEKDRGLYDAINKGIKMATGDVVGICNADDVLADDGVVAKVVEEFLTQRHGDTELDAIYADIRFVKREDNPLSTSTSNLDLSRSTSASSLDLLRAAPTTRYCTGKFFRRWMFRFATFPAHPSTFVRKACFEKYGYYSLDYKICADFEMMLRLFWKHRVRAKYLPICTHVMRTGGMSTNGLKSNVQINREDLRAIRANGYWSCLPLIYAKYLFKVWGFLRKK